MNRRDFLKLSMAGVATVVVGSHIPGFLTKNAFAASSTLDITITDALKDMVTHNEVNTAQCYLWIYDMTADGVRIPPESPGPTIYATQGDQITVNITNLLDEDHSFFIPGRLPSDPPIFDSGVIRPGETKSGQFIATQAGAHLYFDNLNAPVNRVMGLHGALIVRPSAALSGHNFTPYEITAAAYANGTGPAAHVQHLYDSFGTSVFPGLKWEEGDPNTNCPGFRHFVWLYHQASPNLFLKVGNFPAGQDYPAAQFMQEFTRSPFSATRNNDKPQYFTINGQSGFFSHFSPAITPICRVGEPVVIHILNAGLQTVSHHMHCNHFFITSINGEVNPNPIWLDVYGVKPMDRIDYTFPFMRPPDVPNARGIGRPDQPLITTSGHPCWPPIEEMEMHVPPLGTTALNQAGTGTVELAQRLSPLCYPAHDHLETSQTAQGGNYNMGLISGAYVFGDRNAQSQGLGNHMNFPMDEDFAMMFRNIRGTAVDGVNATREAAGPRPVPG